MLNMKLIGVPEFLMKYTGMSILPAKNNDLMLGGIFEFSAQPDGKEEIRDDFILEITVPNRFPHVLPKVKELERKIPRNGSYHVNDDKTLCLGSPLRLIKELSAHPTLLGYTDFCIVPYLYAVSHKLKYGGELVFGELAHGKTGLIDDYRSLFGLKNKEQVYKVLEILGNNERKYFNKPCPCGCGKKFKHCSFRFKLRTLGEIAPRAWFRIHAKNIVVGL